MMEAANPEMHSNLDDDSAKMPIEQKAQNSSKLESLSREDLIKLVKKQLLNQKEIKKQLEAAKKDVEENTKRTTELEKQQQFGGGGIGNGETSMLTAELNDYRNAIGIVRKELQECKEQLAEKESLIEELSNRIAELQQQKEETHEELRKKLAEAMDLREAVEEKSKVIGENSKQINGLLVQLNESRQAMQEEMDGMRQTLQQQTQQLAAVQRADLAKNAELRRMKCENETIVQRLKGIEEEFADYRERAEYALKAKMANGGMGTANTAQYCPNNENNFAMENSVQKASTNEEVNQLVDILRQRNAEISQLSAKCSFLEEEVRGSQSHTKTLVDELNALHDSIGQIRRQSQMERQRIGQELSERMKVEVALKAQMEREMKEKEAAVGKEMAGMRMEMARMTKELKEMRKKDESLSADEKLSFSTSPNRQKTPQFGGGSTQKSINRPQKLKLLPTHCSNQINEQLEMNGGEDGEGGGMHSESCGSDSLEDLQSILQEAELAPTNEIPSFNIASLAEGDDGRGSMAINSPFEYSLAEMEQLQKQLADCRELLSESEETNIRLTEQINVLKEEIRRLERNQKRAEHLVGNEFGSEYFKNIVLKFLSPPKVNDERIQLLPVLQTILHLDDSELELVRRYCSQKSLCEGNDATAEEGENGASGTLSDWASLFGWK